MFLFSWEFSKVIPRTRWCGLPKVTLGVCGRTSRRTQVSSVLAQCLLFTQCFIYETSLATQTRLILLLLSMNKI